MPVSTSRRYHAFKKRLHANIQSAVNYARSFLRPSTRSLSVMPSIYIVLPLVAVSVFFVLAGFITLLFFELSPKAVHHDAVRFTDADIRFAACAPYTVSRVLDASYMYKEGGHGRNIMQLQVQVVVNGKEVPTFAQLLPPLQQDSTPVSMYKLATALQMHGVVRAELVTIPLPLPPAMASRAVARYVRRHLRRHGDWWKGASNLTLLVFALGVPPSSIIRKGEASTSASDTVPPYMWRLGVAQSNECTLSPSNKRQCETVRDALSILYLAGCKSINEMQVVSSSPSSDMGSIKFVQQLDCFSFTSDVDKSTKERDQNHNDNEIIKDVYKKYALATCDTAISGADRVHSLALSDVDVDVRLRAASLGNWIETELSRRCRGQ